MEIVAPFGPNFTLTLTFDSGKPSKVTTPDLQVSFNLQYRTKSGKIKFKKTNKTINAHLVSQVRHLI